MVRRGLTFWSRTLVTAYLGSVSLQHAALGSGVRHIGCSLGIVLGVRDHPLRRTPVAAALKLPCGRDRRPRARNRSTPPSARMGLAMAKRSLSSR
jgi:hypothetical protein